MTHKAGGLWYLLRYNCWVLLQWLLKQRNLRVAFYYEHKKVDLKGFNYDRYLRSDDLALVDGSRMWDSGPLSQDELRRGPHADDHLLKTA